MIIRAFKKNALFKYTAIYQKYLGRKMYLIYILTMVSVIVDSFGLVLLFPILQSVMGAKEFDIGLPDGAALDSIERWLEQSVSYISFILNLDMVASLIILVILVFAVKAILVFGATSYNNVLRARLLLLLKKTFFNKALSMKFEYFSSKASGHFVNLLNEQSLRAIQCFYNLSQCLGQLTATVLYISLALLVSHLFAIIVTLSGIVVFLIYKKLNQTVEKYSNEMVYEKGLLSGQLIQFFQNFGYLTATNLNDILSKNVFKKFSSISMIQKRIGIANAITKASQEFMVVSVIMLVMLYFAVFHKSELSQILLSVLLLYRAVSNILGFQLSWQSTLETIGSIVAIEKEIANLEYYKVIKKTEVAPIFSSTLNLKDICYEQNQEKILKNIDLEITRGKSYAIVGHSGSGKSTITRIISGLIEPTTGEILIDGRLLSEIDIKSWRRQLGFITQDPVIFDESIFYNIALKDKNSADKKEVATIESLMSSLDLASVIGALKDGYDTRMGEQGHRFSGGQRQRLFLAREMFRDPEFLILDEATSALDRKSEKLVQSFIDEAMKEKTVILIAHRLETIVKCDYIIFLKDGAVYDFGLYGDVLRRNPDYFRGID